MFGQNIRDRVNVSGKYDVYGKCEYSTCMYNRNSKDDQNRLYRVSQKKRYGNSTGCININVAKQLHFYIRRKNSYFAFQ